MTDASKLLTVVAEKLRDLSTSEYYSYHSNDDMSELESAISFAVRRVLDGVASCIEESLLSRPDEGPDTDTTSDTPSVLK